MTEGSEAASDYLHALHEYIDDFAAATDTLEAHNTYILKLTAYSEQQQRDEVNEYRRELSRIDSDESRVKGFCQQVQLCLNVYRNVAINAKGRLDEADSLNVFMSWNQLMSYQLSRGPLGGRLNKIDLRDIAGMRKGLVTATELSEAAHDLVSWEAQLYSLATRVLKAIDDELRDRAVSTLRMRRVLQWSAGILGMSLLLLISILFKS